MSQTEISGAFYDITLHRTTVEEATVRVFIPKVKTAEAQMAFATAQAEADESWKQIVNGTEIISLKEIAGGIAITHTAHSNLTQKAYWPENNRR